MLLAYTLRKQVIASARPFVESDARSNTQLMRCPVVRDGAIRACVAMPLGKAEGGVVGALLAVDRKAREWLVPQLDFLEKLSILIVSVVELRAAVTVSLNNESTGISSSPMVSPVRTLLFS